MGLTAELVVNEAMEFRFVGVIYGGNIKPAPFLCLSLRMLQIPLEKDLIVGFIKNEDFKYIHMLGALYMRPTGTAIDWSHYKYLEPLYNDCRRIKSQNQSGKFELVHVDEFIDELLTVRESDIILARPQEHRVPEQAARVEPPVSALDKDMDEVESSEEEEEKLDRVPLPDHHQRSY